MAQRLVSSETNRVPEGTNLLPKGSVASTAIAVGTPSFTSVVSCALNAIVLTSTGLAIAGTARVALWLPAVTDTVRLWASAARVPNTHRALTSPLESISPGACSTRPPAPATLHDPAAPRTGRPSPSTAWNVIWLGSG